MPGSTRHITTYAVPLHQLADGDKLRIETEVTDIRVWTGDQPEDEEVGRRENR